MIEWEKRKKSPNRTHSCSGESRVSDRFWKCWTEERNHEGLQLPYSLRLKNTSWLLKEEAVRLDSNLATKQTDTNCYMLIALLQMCRVCLWQKLLIIYQISQVIYVDHWCYWSWCTGSLVQTTECFLVLLCAGYLHPESNKLRKYLAPQLWVIFLILFTYLQQPLIEISLHQ